MSWIRRNSTWVSVIVLGLLAYVPALSAAPGRMPSDSKLYIYLDPGRFLADATTTMDPRQFAGWVPHQHISYLWPTGPWFWLFDLLGVPDWIAHRLWIGTLLVAAGLGVRWMSRVIGLAPLAALVAALVYQLSPYVLPYISRTSVLLLPWAGLGWIVGCTALAAHPGPLATSGAHRAHRADRRRRERNRAGDDHSGAGAVADPRGVEARHHVDACADHHRPRWHCCRRSCRCGGS